MLAFIKKNWFVFDSLAAVMLFFLAVTEFFFDNKSGERKWNTFLGIIFLGLAIVKVADMVMELKHGRKPGNAASDINKN